MIVYSKSTGLNNAAIGKLETPIKMIIEHESDILTKKGGICDALFNVEKSSRFGETIVGGTDFNIFTATAEGEAAPQDTVVETYQKFIEHIQFMKEFIITAEMMEDANYGIAADAKHRAETFIINRYCYHLRTSLGIFIKTFVPTPTVLSISSVPPTITWSRSRMFRRPRCFLLSISAFVSKPTPSSTTETQ